MRVIPQGRPPKRGGPRQVPRSPPLKHTTEQKDKLIRKKRHFESKPDLNLC